jgi:hypothetical protein
VAARALPDLHGFGLIENGLQFGRAQDLHRRPSLGQLSGLCDSARRLEVNINEVLGQIEKYLAKKRKVSATTGRFAEDRDEWLGKNGHGY